MPDFPVEVRVYLPGGQAAAQRFAAELPAGYDRIVEDHGQYGWAVLVSRPDWLAVDEAYADLEPLAAEYDGELDH